MDVSGVRSSCETNETISLFAWFNSNCAVESCMLTTTPEAAATPDGPIGEIVRL